jgi:hypothetical protein
MANLSAHGTELDRFEYATCRVVVMSDGAILRDRGDGFRTYRKVNPKLTPRKSAVLRRLSYNARMAACPTWELYIMALRKEAGTLKNRGELHAIIQLMPHDPDGIWSTMEDAGEGGGRSLDDICNLCELYVEGNKEVWNYRQNKNLTK